MAERRLTREERKADTRARLMAAAAAVAVRRGLEGASIDEIAQEAGFTKGAVYAHFESKDALFLALLDERFAIRIAELDAVMAGGGAPEEQARQAAADFIRGISAIPGWERLFLELAVHATRNEEFRRELVARYRMLRERIAALLDRRARELGVEPTISADRIAAMTFAMANGMAIERLIEPEAVPDDLYPTMMAIFFTGLREHAEASSPTQRVPA